MPYNIPIIAPTLPEGFCSQLTGANWPQILANEIVGKAVAQFGGSGFTAIINQQAVPGINDIDKLWRQPSTAALGLYQYTGGQWIIVHPSPPGSNERRWWMGTPVELRSFDGGDGTATVPTVNVGAMWEVDADFVGRSPMHPGLIPTANPVKTLAVGENYGEGAHTQTDQEVSAHTHNVTFSNQPNAKYTHWSYDSGSPDGQTQEPIGTSGPGVSPEGMTANLNTFTTTQQAMPVIHPVRGIYCIRRTARLNYVGS